MDPILSAAVQMQQAAFRQTMGVAMVKQASNGEQSMMDALFSSAGGTGGGVRGQNLDITA